MEMFYLLVWGLFWGAIASAIGNSKGIKGFWWGFFLGFIGVIIVACMQSKMPIQTVVVNDNRADVDNKYDKLDKLNNLKKSGAISDKEFEDEKEKLLN